MLLAAEQVRIVALVLAVATPIAIGFGRSWRARRTDSRPMRPSSAQHVSDATVENGAENSSHGSVTICALRWPG